MTSADGKEKMDKETSVIIDKLSDLETIIHLMSKRLDSLEDSTRRQLLSLEARLVEHVSSQPSPYQQDSRGFNVIRKVGPAMSITENAVGELTPKKRWATVEEVARETGRSEQTESAYLKSLSAMGRVHRKPLYEGKGTNRRVRRYVYANKKEEDASS